MKLRVGDEVRVKDWGKMLTTSSDLLVNDNTISRDLLARYAFGDNSHFAENRYNDNTKYEILRILGDVVLIGKNVPSYCINPVYLIYDYGLELACPPKKMTVSEIEGELGYRVEIIAENEE